MFMKKGNKRHRLLGRVFYYSMVIVSISSVFLSVYKDLMFLFHIAIFVFYQAHAGFRSAHNKSLKPTWFDFLMVPVAFLNGLLMIKSLNPVLVIFGAISLLLVYLDLKIFYSTMRDKPLKKLTWLSRHIGMMIGAYIGSVTAFLVVNINAAGFYSLIIWLGPTIILVPLMRYWVYKYTGKQNLSKIYSENS